MKKTLVLALDDEELAELLRIMIDRDGEAALHLLERHLWRPARHALEGG